MNRLQSENRLYWGVSGTASTPMRKLFLSEAKDGMTTPSILPDMPLNQHAARELEVLFSQKSVFDTPKPVDLLSLIVHIGSNAGDLVLDFFSGSGSLGEAVMSVDAAANTKRRFILVQLPESINPEVGEQKIAAGYCDKLKVPRNIAELTKERLRRAGIRIRKDHPLFCGDLGFRVFKLSPSNIRAWNPNSTDLAQTLFANQDHLVEGRTEADVLYELLIKRGLDLCVPIAQRVISGKDVHSVGGGVLMACLATPIEAAEVEAVAQGIATWRKELAPAGDTTCVFRDSAFADDVAKTNMAAILEQNGIANVRSL